MTREEAIQDLAKWTKQMKDHGVPPYSAKYKALKLAIEALQKQEHDGCKDCAFEGRMYYQSPCSDCKQNYTDKWRAKPIKKEFTEEYLIKVFEDKFQGRRAISLDEVREVTKEIFK